MISNFFSELLRLLSLFHDPGMIVLVLLVNVGFGEITHHFQELSDLFVILEDLPILYVVRYGWYVPYLYVVLWFEICRRCKS